MIGGLPLGWLWYNTSGGAFPPAIPGSDPQFKRTVTLAAGDHTIICTVTDTNGLVSTDQITVHVLPDTTTGGPPPLITSPVTNLQWSIVHTDHNGNRIGEAIGQDLRFGKYMGNAGFCSYSLHKSQALANTNLEPNAVDYNIFLDGELLAAGEITDVERDSDQDVIDVTGQDWQGYLASLVIPYTPNNPVNFIKVNTDLKDIVESLVSFVISKYSNTIEIKMNNDPSGLLQTWHFLASDLTDLASMIDQMSTQTQGFDWEITPDKVLNLYFPLKTGTTSFVCDEGNIRQIHFGKQGVRASTLYGRGTGSGTSQLTSRQSNTAVAQGYRDRVSVVDYTLSQINALGQVTERDLNNRYGKQLLQFWVTVVPPVGYNLWADIQPGYMVGVDFNDGSIVINGSYRVVGMETFVDTEGNPEVTFNFTEGATSA